LAWFFSVDEPQTGAKLGRIITPPSRAVFLEKQKGPAEAGPNFSLTQI